MSTVKSSIDDEPQREPDTQLDKRVKEEQFLSFE